ncbi:hypothetical protein B0T25DRAFT_527866 [Lasiosphaeria hispida]|uniref:Secreted protein n=1 Tax=Lasiosphaeria hispida TaxID=260671 RepID=A0AAJ0HVA6_9PEZI|nr:hypothetical protein B0T25DRAFT_527866 [Lasiosphaeria hispida]
MKCCRKVLHVLHVLALCNTRFVAVSHHSCHRKTVLPGEVVWKGVTEPHVGSTSLFKRPESVSAETGQCNDAETS